MIRRRATTRRGLLAAGAAAMASIGGAAWAGQVDVGEPPPGKGQIVFFRRWYWGGGANTYMVREGEREIGRLPNSNYFIAAVDPGWHTFTVKAEKHVDMQIEIEAGETYYVLCELGTGWILYQPMLTPTEQRVFDEISAKLTLSTPVG